MFADKLELSSRLNAENILAKPFFPLSVTPPLIDPLSSGVLPGVLWDGAVHAPCGVFYRWLIVADLPSDPSKFLSRL